MNLSIKEKDEFVELMVLNWNQFTNEKITSNQEYQKLFSI